MPSYALTPAQEEQVRAWIRSGDTIAKAHTRAVEAGWQVSQAKIGQIAQEARRRPAPAAAPEADVAPSLEALTAEVRQLRQEMQALRQRIDTVEAPTLKEAAIRAVLRAERLSQDPEVVPQVQVKALETLPVLIRLAKEIQEAENDAGDGLWSPEEPPAQPADAPAE